MAQKSPYEHQLREACRLVTEQVRQKGEGGRGKGEGEPLADSPALPPFSDWQLVFQSRSGPPSQPWLELDIRDHIRQLHEAGGVQDVVVAPISFLTEHLEVIYDLDIDVGQLCDELGINMVRAAVVGTRPRFVRMIRELIVERIDRSASRLALGSDGPWPDECRDECCRSVRM